MLPRVVITGMGVVSPNGTGKEAFCRAVLAGKSGVKRISRFDSSHLPVHVAGEIPEFDELAWVDARERKHVSRVVPLCLAATTETLSSGLTLNVWASLCTVTCCFSITTASCAFTTCRCPWDTWMPDLVKVEKPWELMATMYSPGARLWKA